MARKVNYKEGDCFSVPIVSGGYARGVVCRSGHGGLLYGLFFPPICGTLSELSVDEQLVPDYAIYRCICGDRAFRKNEWKVIGGVSNWSRAEWTLPRFLKWDEDDKKGWLAEYDEETLNIKAIIPITELTEDMHDYPKDSVLGYKLVEKRLSQLLSNES